MHLFFFISAAENLIACGVHKGKLKASYLLQGHRDSGKTETTCPGDDLYGYIKTWINYPGSGRSSDRDTCEGILLIILKSLLFVYKNGGHWFKI